MKTAMFGLALASLVSMTVSLAPAADLAGSYERNYAGRYERNYITRDNAGCSCDAPGVGLVCATPYRCMEMSGLCEGRCTYGLTDNAGCSCDAPGIVLGPVCATPRRCEEMSGLCEGRCSRAP